MLNSMTSTGLEAFDTTLQKTHELLNDVMHALMIQDKRRAYIALKVTLHAVRDRLPVIEAVQFAGPFTLLLKGIYFEGWVPGQSPEKISREEFLGRVNKQLIGYIDTPPEDVVRTVLKVIIRRTGNTLDDVKRSLPEDFWGFIPGREDMKVKV